LASDDAARHARDFAVLSDARRKQVYWATYSAAGDRLTGPQLSPPTEVAAALDGQIRYVVGAGAALYPEVFHGYLRLDDALYPSAATLGDMTIPKLKRRAPGDDLTPLYLRRPDAVPPGALKQVTPA
jgi:tRNA A37 threonylcarbamoyladenosine modification protein TsaB